MSLKDKLITRSNNQCELCGSSENLQVYVVPPKVGEVVSENAFICECCRGQIENKLETDVNHWRCLNESMWSEVPAIQVLSYRMLRRLRKEDWSRDLLDIIYMEPGVLSFAKSFGDGIDDEDRVIHKDSNGAILQPGDTVVLIKDLKVKGGNFTAKRGTAVRNITLDPDNEKYIEGKVEGQKIVIITDYVKK